jgi:hypothetical protein
MKWHWIRFPLSSQNCSILIFHHPLPACENPNQAAHYHILNLLTLKLHLEPALGRSQGLDRKSFKSIVKVLTMGDWSDCWLRVSAMEKLSLGSFLEESELMRDLDRRTSGVDERFLFTSPINSKQAHRNKTTLHTLRYTIHKFTL